MGKSKSLQKGHWYFAYDDGKINMGRLYKVVVLSVIPFKEASEALLKDWCASKAHCYWIFSDKTPYFIKTKVLDDIEPPVYFALMKDKKSFYSFQRSNNSFWGSNFRLDLTGKLTGTLIKYIHEGWTEKDYQGMPSEVKTAHKKLERDFVEWKKQ